MSKITNDFRSNALRRGVLVKTNRGSSEQAFAYAASIELANLGFIVDPSELVTVDNKTIVATINEARRIVGADRDMTPIYPGFPKQVQELSTMTLLVEQILHYWTAGAFLPNYPTVAREGLPIEDMLRNARSLRVLSAGETSRALTKELASNPVALSESDKELLQGAIELKRPSLELVEEIVKTSRNGENIQSFIRSVQSVGAFTNSDLAEAVIKNTFNTDVILRTLLTIFTKSAADKWDANYDLAVNTLADRHSHSVRMLNIPRSVRRIVVKQLGKTTTDFKADALVNRQNLWRKVMTAIHPFDFKPSDFDKRAVDIIHSNVEYKTLNSAVEEAMGNKDVNTAVEMLAKHQPGNLLRRVVALLRLVDNLKDAKLLSEKIQEVGGKSNLTTLISAYNGILSANSEHARVNRVAGLNNTMLDRSNVVKVNEGYVALVIESIKYSITEVLKNKKAPVGAVNVLSTAAVPLVRRDASTTDRNIDRGAEFAIAGEGDTLRIFSHWNNNQSRDGYMDIGAVVLDSEFNQVGVSTWNSWAQSRAWSTYSGDKNVYPGGSAAEYFDIDLKKVREIFPNAIYVAMTIQSWSGWPVANVDIIAGAMLRSKPNSGEVFDARTVATAFKPTTDSTQSVPLAVDLRSNKMIWVDSSNGSDEAGSSSTNDDSIGSIVYDELERPRFTLGELATLWADAHGVETVQGEVVKEDLLNLL
jgi:hypothetical protein